MQAIADLLEEQVKRRECHRKFNDDNARRMWGLEVMEHDVPKVHKHVHIHQEQPSEDQKDVKQTEELVAQQQPQSQPQPQLQEPPKQEKNESLLKKWGPAALVGVSLGAGAMSIPLLLGNGEVDKPTQTPTTIVDGGSDQPATENATDGDSVGDITVENPRPDKKSIFTVIQDELKHIED